MKKAVATEERAENLRQLNVGEEVDEDELGDM
jgi:hypothetical protein